MDKNQFLITFYDALEGLPGNIKADIMSEYQQIFRVKMEEGQTEEEITASLGDPFALAYAVKQRRGYVKHPSRRPISVVRFLFMGFILLMFNVIFVLAPCLGAIGALIGLWGAAFGLSLGGVAFLGGTLISFFSTINLMVQSHLSFLTVISASVFATSIGLLLGMGCLAITRWSFKVLGRYFKWNIHVLLGR